MQRRDVLKFFGAAAALPPESLFRADPEAYWTQLRKDQFLLPDWRCFLNNGSLGVTPKPVLKAVTDYLERAAALLLDDYPRWGYETLDAERAKMAAFAGCTPNELAFTHNATEAISIVAAGVDLKAGDEVLITDQEHVSGKNPWFLRAQRTGITVREVKLPVPPKSAAELADVFTSAIGPRTKMISFSGIVSALGFRMPSREICDYARSKGILTLVDGAHMHGQVPVKISDLHCDFFAGSPHKWLFAPAGCGLLYVREEMLDRLWPSIVTGNWDNRKLGAARFMQVGTNNRAIIEGMMAGLDFHHQIGSERVFGRIHELAKLVYRRASEAPYLKLLSPADDTMWGGLVSFEITKDAAALWPRLKERKVWTTGGSRLRVSTHVHTRREDIEVFFGILRETLG
jgi:isopenicillin-N epimerase